MSGAKRQPRACFSETSSDTRALCFGGCGVVPAATSAPRPVHPDVERNPMVVERNSRCDLPPVIWAAAAGVLIWGFALGLFVFTTSTRNDIRGVAQRIGGTTSAVRNEIRAPATSRWLTCALMGGLTNQEIEAEDCLMLAQQLGRRLVLPRPFVEVTGTYADSGGASRSRFSDLWDVDEFVSCANRSHGVAVVPTPELPVALEVVFAVNGVGGGYVLRETSPRGLLAGLLERSLAARCDGNGSCLIQRERAGELIRQGRADQLFPDAYSHVAAMAPFYVGGGGERAACFRPNARVRIRAARILERMPRSFVCLHLRAEEDWWKHCCGEPLRSWGAPTGGFIGRADLLPALCQGSSRQAGSRPSPACYRSPLEVVATLRHHRPVSPHPV